MSDRPTAQELQQMADKQFGIDCTNADEKYNNAIERAYRKHARTMKKMHPSVAQALLDTDGKRAISPPETKEK